MLIWTIGGEQDSIAWDDLKASFAWLSLAPRAIFTISNSSSAKIGTRLTDNSENRRWWLAEFGLHLSAQT